MKMANGYYISLNLAQGIPKARMARVNQDDCFFAPDAKAGMAKPGDVQINDLPKISLAW